MPTDPTPATPSVADLLATPNALLTRTHLRQLGHGRRAVDAIFAALNTVHLPGYSRPYVSARDYVEWIEEHTHDGTRVRHAA